MNILLSQIASSYLEFICNYKKLSKNIKTKYASYLVKLFLIHLLKNTKGKDESIAI